MALRGAEARLLKASRQLARRAERVQEIIQKQQSGRPLTARQRETLQEYRTIQRERPHIQRRIAQREVRLRTIDLPNTAQIAVRNLFNQVAFRNPNNRINDEIQRAIRDNPREVIEYVRGSQIALRRYVNGLQPGDPWPFGRDYWERLGYNATDLMALGYYHGRR